MNYGILGIFIAKDIFHFLLQDSESHVSTLSLHKVKSCRWRIPQCNQLLYLSFTDTELSCDCWCSPQTPLWARRGRRWPSACGPITSAPPGGPAEGTPRRSLRCSGGRSGCSILLCRWRFRSGNKHICLIMINRESGFCFGKWMRPSGPSSSSLRLISRVYRHSPRIALYCISLPHICSSRHLPR